MSMPLSTALQRWASEDAWEVRLQIDLADGTCLLFRRPGLPVQWMEFYLNDTQMEHAGPSLREHGLRKRRHQNGARALGKPLSSELASVEGRAALLAELDVLLGLVEAAPPGRDTIGVTCQREQPPENPQLLEAIRAVSTRKDDEDTRKRLYAAIANATFLVPLQPETVGLGEGEQQPLLVQAEGGPEGAATVGRTWIAFSDWDALRQWRPQGHPFGLVHGVDLVRHANVQKASGLRINPDGVAGGALFPAEIEMMAQAVQGYLAKRTS